MMGAAHFLASMTVEFKNNYSREIYKLLIKQDHAFRYNAKYLHLKKEESNVDDRFVFLFLCKKILESTNEELSIYIYFLRRKGFQLTVSEKDGIGIIPNLENWNTAEKWKPNNGIEKFKEAWLMIKQEDKEWIQNVFDNMPQEFPEFSQVNL